MGRRFRTAAAALAAVAVAVVCSACSSAASPTLDEPAATTAPEAVAIDPLQKFPDVIDVEADRLGNGPMDFVVMVSSPYDTPERYADAWRVVDAVSGDVLGIRELDHDHQNEQPFVRSLTGVEVPESVTQIRIEARDSVNGWGGGTITLDISG